MKRTNRSSRISKDKTKYTIMADPEGEAAFFNNAMGSAVAEDFTLTEAKVDIDNFINKFGQDKYDLFIKAKDRLKNNKISTDITWHTKNTSPEELDNMLQAVNAKTGGNKDLSKVDFSKSQIPGKYKYYGRMGNYDVYEPLDYISSMALGVNTGWCTTGRYGHYGEPGMVPSKKEADRHFNEYTGRGIKLIYLLNPSTHYGEIAVAVYPKIIELEKTIKEKDKVILLRSTNFEIFNAEDENDYSLVKKLPNGFIDKFDLEIDYETLTDLKNIKKVFSKDVEKITLLSVEEAEKVSEENLECDCSWWLRSPGIYSYYATYVNGSFINDYYGDFVDIDDGAVRPALIINQKSEPYENIKVFDRYWTYIGNNLYLLANFEKPLTEMAFNSNRDKGNDYETSDIKKWLDNWLQEQKSKYKNESLRNNMKNTFKFKLVESIDEKVKLHYDDLLYEIAVDFDKDTNAYSYEEKHNPFDYEVDKEKVIDVLYDICIGKKEFDNYSEEEIEDHIRNNFNNVLKTYYTDVLNEFEDDAKQKAEYDYYEEQENVYYDSLEEDKNNTTQKDKSREFSVFGDIKTGLEQAIDYEKANHKKLNSSVEKLDVVHLSDIVKTIDFFVIYDDIKDAHLQSEFDDDIEEEYDESDAMLFSQMSDEQLLELSKDTLNGITDFETLDRLSKLDKSKLTADQLKILQNHFRNKIVINKEDIEKLIDVFKQCNNIEKANYFKTIRFMKKNNLSDEDCLDIIHNLKSSDYYANTRSIDLDYLGNNLIIFEPKDVELKDGRHLSNIVIYVKLDIDKTTNDTIAMISMHDTDKQNKLPYA